MKNFCEQISWENEHLEDREKDGKITLSCIFRKGFVRIGGEPNWLRIASNFDL
jgi:hypothetical protein